MKSLLIPVTLTAAGFFAHSITTTDQAIHSHFV
jgi:hypothetical protein